MGAVWNFGDLLDGVARVVPGDAPAILHGETLLSWSEFTKMSNNLAAAFIARGAEPGDKVAFYMRNRAEYLVCLAACFKARLVHVNVNYRYTDEELHYIFDNSDSKFVLFGEEFAPFAERLSTRTQCVSHWIQADGDAPSFAESLAALCADGGGEPLDTPRSPDDL